MATTYNSGGLKSSDVTASTTSAGVGTAPDRRRLYNFGDRVHELNPEESPFFVYLSQINKVPTDDSVFRYLENRNPINWTNRSFVMANAPGTVVAGSSYSFQVADAASPAASIDWLQKGMVFAVQSADTTDGISNVIVRVDSAVTDQGTTSAFTGRVVSLSNSGVTGYNAIADNDNCQVIGTSFEEGSGAPDVFSTEIEDNYGYTQIFKTAAEMTGTALATRFRGYDYEWNRIWSEKLREHKVDIERAMLFGQKARIGGIQYTEGIIGHILKNVNPTNDNSAFSYSSGSSYYRRVADSELTYDRLLSDLEVIFDPARGSSSDKLVLCSLPVITFFNKMGDGKFVDGSLGHSNAPYKYDIESRTGAFGHKVMMIDTVHGTLNLVKEPLFRGISASYMLMADMKYLLYRPLVGNGYNRDTQIQTNVQSIDEDLRKDMIMTEAGLEVCLPESHALYDLEGV
jgi:hypothetical protein|tara:strand:+ start:2089 stop:3462 length:1374 start_codon:yes stop_codon:yes gene_type:complete